MDRNGPLLTGLEFKSYQNRIPGFTTQVVFKNGTSSVEQGLIDFQWASKSLSIFSESG